MARRSTLSVLWRVGWLNITLAALAATAGEPADVRLQTAYRELRFAEMYPPEAVQLIQTRLQDAPRAVTVLAELAKEQQSSVRILVATLLGHLGEAAGADTLWVLLLDPVESVRVTASGALLRLRKSTPITSSFAGLKHESPAVRGLTAATLGSLGDKNAEPSLVEALSDPEERVRLEVARALGSCGTKASVPPMLKQLSQEKSVLSRTALVRTLGGHQGPEVTDALTKSLNEDPDWHVRAAAALGLGGLCANPAEGKRMTDMMSGKVQGDDFALVRDRAVDALGAARGEEAMLALVQAILSDSCDSRVHAVQSVCLNKIAGIVPHLMPHVYHPTAEVREKILVIFGTLGGQQQLPVVAEATADPDPSVRLAAVNALRQMGQRGGSAVLLAKLADSDPHIRAAAVRVLGGMGDRSVSLKLLPLLQDDSGFVRAATAEALGKLGDRSAILPLIDMLVGKKLGPEEGAGGQGLVVGLTNTFLNSIAEMTGPNQKVRVVEALGVLRAAESVDAVVEHGLRAEDPTLRAVSAYTLGQIGDPKAVGPLQSAVRPYYDTMPLDTTYVINPGIATEDDKARQRREGEARVRASVAWALGQIGDPDPSVRGILKQALNDPNSLVRDAATEALTRIEEKIERLAARSVSSTQPR